MAGAFLIMLREGLEAALIVGIILVVLTRLEGPHPGSRSHVGWGVAAALVASVLFAVFADGVGDLFQGAGQEVLNGAIMAVAAVMLTYVVVWVRNSRKGMSEELARQVRERAAARGLGIFVLVFLTVFREGFESVLFLWGVALRGAGASGFGMFLGGLAGLAAAAGLAWAIFTGGRKVPMAVFFNVTMVLLVLLAAGMLSGAAGSWVAVDWLPALSYSVWDTSAVLPEDSGLGGLASILLGYNANPTLMEVLVYAGYLGSVVLWLMVQRSRPPVLQRAAG
ncbi:MAG: FTR1 family protein [Nitrospirota bacterium]|nr:FTR1 family protein [Nitrospirota bacterium]